MTMAFKPNFAILAGAGGLSLAALMTSSALAQTTVAQTTEAKAKAKIEVIVVTADRKNTYGADLVQAGSFRGAKQLDTPLTVAVIPQEVLVSQQAQGLIDALKNTAGVTASQLGTTVYSNMSIRGITVENRGNFRLDGSLPIVNLIDLPVEDKERVEVLKGASALYYGFTTPAGIVNMTMKRPTLQPLLETTLSANDHGAAAIHVDAGGTVGKLGARVNAVYGGVDSGIDNTYGHRALFATAIDYKPTDKLTLSFDGEYIHKKITEPGIFFLSAPKSTISNLYPAITLPSLVNAKSNFGPRWASYDATEFNWLGRAYYKINDAWDFTFEGGQSQMVRDRHFSMLTLSNAGAVSGAGTLTVYLQPGGSYRNRNWRSELAGTFYTGPFLHNVLFGYSQNIRDQAATTSTKLNFAQNYLSPVDIPGDESMGPRIGATTRIDDRGAYLFDRVQYGDWLNLLMGVRSTDYTESNVTTNTVTYHARPTSASYGVVIKPKTWVSLYGTYIEGLESTAATPSTAANAGAQLPPTESKQKEMGVKIEPKRGLLFQAGWFNIDRGAAYTDANNYYVLDGKYRYEGTELNLTGDVTRDLSIYASAVIMNARQIEGAATKVSGGTVTPTQVGLLVENTAKHTYSLAGEYRLNRWVKGLSMTAAVYTIGKRAVNPLNEAFIPGYTTYDLGLSYATDIEGHRTIFRINGQNITDVKYWAATGANYLAQGAPAQVKFSVSTRY
jgi:iron complex outermembrane receptor protein